MSAGAAIRIARAEDGGVCGPLCFDAFAAISGKHGFLPDFPGPEIPTHLLSTMFGSPDFYCVVAEKEGRVVGSNCLDERSAIRGVGPITVAPGTQNSGIGRMLMEAVIHRAQERGAAGIRLVQAAYHSRSLSLYASLGFDVREPLACMQGRTLQREVPGCVVRAARAEDVDACNALYREVHGFDRGTELRSAVERGAAKVVERGSRITGYASELAFFGYAAAESNIDLPGNHLAR